MERNQRLLSLEADAPVGEAQQKLPGTAHVLCGWPLLLMFLGGAIGGAMGGLAYGLNVVIYRSKLPVFAKVALNFFVGLAAIGLWLGSVVLIRLATM